MFKKKKVLKWAKHEKVSILEWIHENRAQLLWKSTHSASDWPLLRAQLVNVWSVTWGGLFPCGLESPTWGLRVDCACPIWTESTIYSKQPLMLMQTLRPCHMLLLKPQQPLILCIPDKQKMNSSNTDSQHYVEMERYSTQGSLSWWRH